ncbi:cell growth regulator with EF hand domain protein 1 isoform X2 [Rhineura floridana]|uniref:cell growth regulator with EF hand domain protein 1 isoform X2 n=1 Tax=Rhineura floridana TaxID=261503 RepID=UPI002AC8102E|nr:cell growth regulator with EF hand domain protein 1 isoform X2 [Rhineura floridana]
MAPAGTRWETSEEFGQGMASWGKGTERDHQAQGSIDWGEFLGAPSHSTFLPFRPDAPHDSQEQLILNPLDPGKESQRLLQDYLKKKVGQAGGDAGAMARKQTLLFLFVPHDYDKSGRLDGLEFLQLLGELGSQQAEGQPTPDLVVLMVDSTPETQDLNHDGLLEPLELGMARPQLSLLPPAEASVPCCSLGQQGLFGTRDGDPMGALQALSDSNSQHSQWLGTTGVRVQHNILTCDFNKQASRRPPLFQAKEKAEGREGSGGGSSSEALCVSHQMRGPTPPREEEKALAEATVGQPGNTSRPAA